jgi:hypothetical protein
MSASMRGTSVSRWMAAPHPNGQLGISVVQSASLLQRPASFSVTSTVARRVSQSPGVAAVPPLASSGCALEGLGDVLSGVGGATATGRCALDGTSRCAEHAASVTIRATAPDL